MSHCPKQQSSTAVILPLNAVSHFSNTCDVNYNIIVDLNTTTVSDTHIVETQKFRQLKVLLNHFNDDKPIIKCM
jgi:DNA polymerase sigma